MVESIFAIVFVMLLALGVVQVAFTLYARNVIDSAAHEAARAALELGRSGEDADRVVGSVVAGAAGGLVTDLVTGTTIRTVGEREVVTVQVSGRVAPKGVVPVSLTFERSVSVSRPASQGR